MSFLGGASWLFGAQILGRVSRLATTLIIARLLSPEHFGIAAIVLTAHEIALVLSRFGTSSALIKCEIKSLEILCQSAWKVNWIIGTILLLVQWNLASVIADFYNNPGITKPLQILSLSYIIMPLGAIHHALTARRGDMQTIAKTEVQQAVADTVITIVLAILGFGIWALILPKLLVIPLWIRAHRKVSPWSAVRSNFQGTSWLLKFGSSIAGVELLAVARHSIDYLIIGYFLGIEALGVYFFAFNAGLGITRSLISAMTSALLPALCRSSNERELTKEFSQALILITLLVTCWVTTQVLLAEWYVPVIFGQKWVDLNALPILITICLCGVPLAFTEACSQFLRAKGIPQRDLMWNTAYTLIFAISIVVGVSWGIQGVALAVLTVTLINMPIYYHFNVKPMLALSRPATSLSNLSTAQ